MCKFIGKFNERILCNLSKSEILRRIQSFMLPWKLQKCHILPVNRNLSSIYFSLSKFQLVSCNLSLAMIWQMTYTHKLPKLCSAALSYTNNINENNNKFSFSSTSGSIVFSHLNKLCRSKATGLDDISAKIISECANLISVSLCDLFNKSLLSGIFLDNWKCARVTPLFKQGEASDLNNCLPISVVSVIAKVFERIVYDQYHFYTSIGLSLFTLNCNCSP